MAHQDVVCEYASHTWFAVDILLLLVQAISPACFGVFDMAVV